MTDAETTPTSQEPPPQRRFLRSRDDRILGGVCSGLAKYFNIDPTIVRIATVALVFLGGTGAIAYAAALVFVPEDDGGDPDENGVDAEVAGDAAADAGEHPVVAGAAQPPDGVLGGGGGGHGITVAPRAPAHHRE